ncbi:MAG TPA: M15 family metallopeptidase [Usitatibacter sp.]|nr:M15 family metallopeptidase [Usitatibacter sp.]
MPATLPIESLHGHRDFRALRDIAGIAVDLRYATPMNFVGEDMYSPYDCAWLHRDAADALQRSVEAIAARRSDLRLLILDALRPQRVQERMWAALQGTPLTQYLADPARGSIHSFGMAVDVTLADANGREVDMGTAFDDLSERSHPALEAQHLARGELTREQVENRTLLRAAMDEAGWRGINSEWWHFDAGDRDRIRASYLRIL